MTMEPAFVNGAGVGDPENPDPAAIGRRAVKPARAPGG